MIGSKIMNVQQTVNTNRNVEPEYCITVSCVYSGSKNGRMQNSGVLDEWKKPEKEWIKINTSFLSEIQES